jgi:hypothetical protein
VWSFLFTRNVSAGHISVVSIYGMVLYVSKNQKKFAPYHADFSPEWYKVGIKSEKVDWELRESIWSGEGGCRNFQDPICKRRAHSRK